MSFLDELEQQAQLRKADLTEAERQKEERELIFKSELEPGMQALREYLTKLTEHLGLVKPASQIEHELPGYGKIIAHIEHVYELTVAQQPTSRELNLTFEAVVATEKCPLVELNSAHKVATVSSAFQRFRLAGLQSSEKDANGEISKAVFRARGKIPLALKVFVSSEAAQVNMQFTNFDVLGVVSRSFSSAQFNEKLFDDLGRFLSREPSNLFREDIPDSIKNQLQQKVQQEQMRRRWEVQIAEQQQQDLDTLRGQQKLGSRVKRALQSNEDKDSAVSPPERSWVDRIKGMLKK